MYRGNQSCFERVERASRWLFLEVLCHPLYPSCSKGIDQKQQGDRSKRYISGVLGLGATT